MKQMKVLGVLAIAFTLGLAACGGAAGGEGGDASSGGKQPSSRHVHTFDETKWESDDTNHWHPATCEHKTQKGSNAKHTFGEPYDVDQATCDKDGSQKVKCTICGKEVTQTIKAEGHSEAPAADSELWTIVTQPKCEEEGVKTYVCTKCNKPVEVKIDALGHLYAQDEDKNDIVEWTVKPTCEEGGTGKKVCTREGCGHEEPVTAEALGHKWTTENGTRTPAKEEGYADFWEFPCANGCGKTSLGFKANEPTARSKTHLVIDDDGGARFWGRPIGNDVALNENGDPSQDSHDPVFNEEQEGDFFEYKFDLSAEQAATLASCRCYCDAKPAGYLGRNGIDFWASKETDTDWTRGMYIEGENKGKEITDYRYILYVDDPETGDLKPVEFDGTKCAVPASEPRAEYEMPYTFHLHEGTNTISLRMAGGYRSIFYNFYFRQYIAPTPAAGE